MTSLLKEFGNAINIAQSVSFPVLPQMRGLFAVSVINRSECTFPQDYLATSTAGRQSVMSVRLWREEGSWADFLR